MLFAKHTGKFLIETINELMQTMCHYIQKHSLPKQAQANFWSQQSQQQNPIPVQQAHSVNGRNVLIMKMHSLIIVS